MKRILVVEDEPALLRAVADNLKLEGFEVMTATRGDRGLELALGEPVDLVVLDVMLPGLDGFAFCREVRAKRGDLPVLILSARDDVADVVRGLELGAEDYVKKPVAMAELLARVRACLRRQEGPAKPSEYRFGDVVLDFKRLEARRGSKPISLTAREFRLLQLFVERRGEVLSRDELLNQVWGYEVYPTTRTVDNFILRLRKLLEEDPAHPRWFVSVRGAGYRFDG